MKISALALALLPFGVAAIDKKRTLRSVRNLEEEQGERLLEDVTLEFGDGMSMDAFVTGDGYGNSVQPQSKSGKSGKCDKPIIVGSDVMDMLVEAFCSETVAISDAFWDNGGKNVEDANPYPQEACDAAYATARTALNGAYNYPDPVLFKPTLTTSYRSGQHTFRPTFQGALSYFIGTECILKSGGPDDYYPPGNSDGSEFKEHGFGLANYSPGMRGFFSCKWIPDSYVEGKNIGVAQGKVSFARNEMDITTVDKTFSFGADENGIGGAVITGHHSSQEITREGSTQFVFFDD